jgi:hypothetical protein
MASFRRRMGHATSEGGSFMRSRTTHWQSGCAGDGVPVSILLVGHMDVACRLSGGWFDSIRDHLISTQTLGGSNYV